MNNKNQRTWVIIGAIVAIVILFLIFRQEKPQSNQNQNTSSPTQTENNQTKTPEASSTPDQNSSSLPAPEGSFTLEGRLEASDDLDRGSIKLVMPDKTLYLRSKQDYSSLYGKQVVIKAYGTSKVFTFQSIEEKK